jgi:hypothetical protein
MNDDDVKTRARTIAASMIDSARGSGNDPIYWVTSNASYPALRGYPEAEHVWMANYTNPGVWNFLVEELERLLEEAYVVMDTGSDGSIYVVDMTRFEFIDENDEAPTLQAQYRMYNAGTTSP